jgi:succinyl-diaminopimelate desuccinylase
MGKTDIVALTSDLIGFDSSAPNEPGRRDVVEYVNGFCFKHKISYKETVCDNGSGPRTSIVAGNLDNPEILFLGHLDVMTGTSNQFSPRVSDGKLYGRGSCDMKGADAVFLSLLAEAQERKDWPTLGIMLSTDEEIGGARGAGHLVNGKGFRAGFVITGEPTQLDVAVKEKAVLQFEVGANGRAAHASRPYLGESAINKLVAGLSRLEAKYNQVSRDQFWTSSFNVGAIRGGFNEKNQFEVNKVPVNATAWIDLRYTDQAQHDLICREVGNAFDTHEVVLDVPMMKTDPNNEYVRKLEACRRRVIGSPSSVDHSVVYSDGRFFTAVGVPVSTFGPVGANAHGDDEWAGVESLHTYRRVLGEFLTDVGRKSSG